MHVECACRCAPNATAIEEVVDCVDKFVNEQLAQNKHYEQCFKGAMGGYSSGQATDCTS